MGANYAYHADGTHKSRSRLAKERKISTSPDTANVERERIYIVWITIYAFLINVLPIFCNNKTQSFFVIRTFRFKLGPYAVFPLYNKFVYFNLEPK